MHDICMSANGFGVGMVFMAWASYGGSCLLLGQIGTFIWGIVITYKDSKPFEFCV